MRITSAQKSSRIKSGWFPAQTIYARHSHSSAARLRRRRRSHFTSPLGRRVRASLTAQAWASLLLSLRKRCGLRRAFGTSLTTTGHTPRKLPPVGAISRIIAVRLRAYFSRRCSNRISKSPPVCQEKILIFPNFFTFSPLHKAVCCHSALFRRFVQHFPSKSFPPLVWKIGCKKCAAMV